MFDSSAVCIIISHRENTMADDEAALESRLYDLALRIAESNARPFTIRGGGMVVDVGVDDVVLAGYGSAMHVRVQCFLQAPGYITWWRNDVPQGPSAEDHKARVKMLKDFVQLLERNFLH